MADLRWGSPLRLAALHRHNLPPQVTLAIATRADPPLPLARLRARGEIAEVRSADLKFTADEAEEFLNDVMGLQLEPSLVGALEARTEGWAAGLQLAALSARARAGAADGCGGVAGFVEAFSGSHRCSGICRCCHATSRSRDFLPYVDECSGATMHVWTIQSLLNSSRPWATRCAGRS